VRARSYFISYPRSGSHWIKQRIRLLLAGISGVDSDPDQRYNWTHYGYAFNPSRNIPGRKVKPPRKSNVVLLLRDAVPIVGSTYHFMHTRLVELGPEDRNLQIEKDHDAFVRGGWGVSRYCAFLNEVSDLMESAQELRWRVKPVFYEDLFSEESIAELPWILGLSFWVSPEISRDIFEQTRQLINPSLKAQKGTIATERYQATKHSNVISKESERYIRGYMDKHCRLGLYRERYIDRGE